MPETTSTSGQVFWPRARVLWGVGGILDPTVDAETEIPWLLSIDVKKCNAGQDTVSQFRCTFALFGDPNASYSFWGNITEMVVDIQVAFDQATVNGVVSYLDWTSLMHGITTNIKQDVVRGVVTITGMDVAGVFGMTHLNQTYTTPNVKDAITDIIQAHGFQADVGGELDVTFGVNRLDEKAWQTLGMASRELNERDLIAKLKNDFGASVWTDPDGKTIHVHVNPPPENGTWIIDAPTPVFLGGAARHQPSNFTDLIFEHLLIFSEQGGANQVVGTRTDTQAKATDIIKVPDDATVGSDTMRVMLNFDGLTLEDAQLHAQKHLLNYIGREWLVEWHTSDPQLINFHVNDVIEVQGTNSSNDGPYALDYIEYSLDAKHGYKAIVHGRVGRDVGGAAGDTTVDPGTG